MFTHTSSRGEKEKDTQGGLKESAIECTSRYASMCSRTLVVCVLYFLQARFFVSPLLAAIDELFKVQSTQFPQKISEPMNWSAGVLCLSVSQLIFVLKQITGSQAWCPSLSVSGHFFLNSTDERTFTPWPVSSLRRVWKQHQIGCDHTQDTFWISPDCLGCLFFSQTFSSLFLLTQDHFLRKHSLSFTVCWSTHHSDASETKGNNLSGKWKSHHKKQKHVTPESLSLSLSNDRWRQKETK